MCHDLSTRVTRLLPSRAGCSLARETIEELGYSNLRVRQKEAILHYVQGKDVFVLLPSASGKSLCYYILPVVFDILRKNSDPKCIVIVVSPLVALMKDQVTSLMSKGVKGVYVTSEMLTKYMKDIIK